MLGGETSGHVICLDKTTTGDGLITALQVIAIMRRTGRALSDLADGMPQLPQMLVNVRTTARVDLGEYHSIARAVSAAESQLGARGRVVLRASGTEPVIRVMVEGEDRVMVQSLAADIAESVRIALN
jgi:phosphoglucosamine mutase